MKNQSTLADLLGIDHPILLAPMFLISNTKMVVAALQEGCTAAIPALNYRTDKELRDSIMEIRSITQKPFGINLIVNKSNPKYKSQLKTLVDLEVDFIITSLGNPKQVIDACKPLKTKVFCDVTDVKYARKVEGLGADAVIAVNSQAGGHCGNFSANELILSLKNKCNLPIISAGGISDREGIQAIMEKGAVGVSIGSIFIATKESDVSEAYKQAIVEYGKADIIKTSKLTGSDLTVINTPYVNKIGSKSNLLEFLVNNSPVFKKYTKMILAWRGMNKVKNSAFKANYNNIWCAGPSIEAVKTIRSVKEVISDLVEVNEK